MDFSEHVQIHVIDRRLGKREENPEEQLLASWPAPRQQSQSERSVKESFDIVRLARGSLGLCSHFCEDVPCASIAFETHTILCTEPEPFIVWIMYTISEVSGRCLCADAGLRTLRQMSRLSMLLNHSVSDMTQSLGISFARAQLQRFVNMFMPGFVRDEGWLAVDDLYGPMTPHRGLPLVLVGEPLFKGLQTLTASLAISNLIPDRPTIGAMLLYKEALLHSTLSAADTEALYHFASRTVIPVTSEQNKTTRTLHKLYHNMSDWYKGGGASLLEPRCWNLRTASGSELEGLMSCHACEEDRGGAEGGGSSSSSRAWSGLHSGPGGSRSSSASRRPEQPLLHLQSRESCRFVAWQSLGFVVVALVAGDAPVLEPELAEARRQIVHILRDLDQLYMAPLLPSRNAFITQVAERVKAHSKGHVQGHRYTLVDYGCSAPVCRSTPLSKLTHTTSHTARAMLGQIWTDAGDHMDAMGGASRSGGEGGDGRPQARLLHSLSSGMGAGAAGAMSTRSTSGLEVVAQAPNKKWVVARWARGTEFLHVDNSVTRDRSALHLASRNAYRMLRGISPGMQAT